MKSRMRCQAFRQPADISRDAVRYKMKKFGLVLGGLTEVMTGEERLAKGSPTLCQKQNRKDGPPKTFQQIEGHPPAGSTRLKICDLILCHRSWILSDRRARQIGNNQQPQ